MKIVFFGTSEFAIPAFRELLSSRHKVLALVSQPDRKRGRRLKVSPPPTKVLALARDIKVYQPENASGYETVDYLKKLEADLFVVVSFGQILKKTVLALPKSYSINLHGSLLPKYRGAAPTNWAIINGDTSSGVTIIKMNERLDEGDIISKKDLEIDQEDTNITLSEKLSEIGARLLLEAMDSIENGKATFEKQDEALATYAPKLKKEDALIDWKEPARVIRNKVRGFIPWPGAYTYSGKKILKVWSTEISDVKGQDPASPGEVIGIVKNKGILVQTGSGSLAITHLQAEGKNILDADSFLRGHRIEKGYVFGVK